MSAVVSLLFTYVILRVQDHLPLVTADFSGVDPDITEAAALIQVNRIAARRNLDSAKVRSLVERHVQGRVLRIFGEPHVNVLDVNMALDSGEAR
jgi:K+-transporting ATPase ATPase C chain